MTQENAQGLSNEQNSVLQAFSRTLMREAYVLSREPSLLWQQLYNRLQWEGDLVQLELEVERKKRCDTKAQPWFHLYTPFHESGALVRTMAGRGAACVFSPDGSKLLTGVVLWDVSSGQRFTTLQGNKGLIADCAYSPDGSRILTIDTNNTLVFWDATTGQAIHTFSDPSRKQLPGGYYSTYDFCCSFSPDGCIVLSSFMARLKMWDVATGQVLRTPYLQDQMGGTPSVFSPNGQFILSKYRKAMTFWDVKTGESIRTLKGDTGGVIACAFSPDGSLVATAHRENLVSLWEVNTGRLRHTFKGHTQSVMAVGFSPDGDRIITAGDKTVRVWEVASRQLLHTLEGHTDFVTACGFSPDGNLVASAGKDSTIRLWKLKDDQPVRSVPNHTDAVNASLFSPDGQCILTGSWDKTIRIWDSASCELLRTIEGHTGVVNACALSPDGGFIASAGEEKTVRIWDFRTGKAVREFSGEMGDRWHACAFSPDGRLVVSVHALVLQLWDVFTGEVIYRLKYDSWLHSCAFSPDGKRILTASLDNTLQLWDVASGKVVRKMKGHSGPVNMASFSPDGGSIVSVSKDGTLMVWDVVRNQSLLTLRNRGVESCAFSPDGQLIASIGGFYLQVCSRLTGDLVAELPLPGQLLSLAFHPWKPMIVCGDKSGAVYLADIHMVTFGPIAVTAEKSADGLHIRCPVCQSHLPVGREDFGKEFALPHPGCETRLKINPFTIRLAEHSKGG